MRGLLFASACIVLVAVSAPSFFTRYLDGPHAVQKRAPSAEAVVRKQEELFRPEEGEEPDATEEEALAPDDEEGPAPEEPPTPAGLKVEVKAARDGHFYVDAEVNFREVRFMVDTGATVVALRQSDAAAAGIRPRPADFLHPVQTANGTTNAAAATLDSVTVAEIEVRNVRALVLPDEQLSVSLLGASFLNGVERFEVTDGTLIFEN
ncbi:MAG: TIGR02281 family clan AA aspartic protease [Propylenella sp.]